MKFRKLNSLILLLASFLLISNVANAKKFPVGYPECWLDSKNPVISTSQQSRNAGVINSTDGLFRSFQIQDFNFYGKSIGISKILLLTPDDYQEKIIHAIEPTFIKNIKGTHHLSYKYDVAAIDFYRYENIKN